MTLDNFELTFFSELLWHEEKKNNSYLKVHFFHDHLAKTACQQRRLECAQEGWEIWLLLTGNLLGYQFAPCTEILIVNPCLLDKNLQNKPKQMINLRLIFFFLSVPKANGASQLDAVTGGFNISFSREIEETEIASHQIH